MLIGGLISRGLITGSAFFSFQLDGPITRGLITGILWYHCHNQCCCFVVVFECKLPQYIVLKVYQSQ